MMQLVTYYGLSATTGYQQMGLSGALSLWFRGRIFALRLPQPLGLGDLNEAQRII